MFFFTEFYHEGVKNAIIFREIRPLQVRLSALKYVGFFSREYNR